MLKYSISSNDLLNSTVEIKMPDKQDATIKGSHHNVSLLLQKLNFAEGLTWREFKDEKPSPFHQVLIKYQFDGEDEFTYLVGYYHLGKESIYIPHINRCTTLIPDKIVWKYIE